MRSVARCGWRQRVLWRNVALVVALGCGSDDGRPPPAQVGGLPTPTTPLAKCEDGDGDGFGLGCGAGPDCDDASAAITNECLCAQAPSPGCACSESGARADCGKVYSRLLDQVICGQGLMACDGERWGECAINGAVTLAKAPSSAALRLQSLGSASPCAANPCDPSCQTFTDSAADLTIPEEAGVVASAAGVTLPGGEAVVVPSITSTGYDCTDASYPVGGGCAHHICKTGTALSEWCDGTAPHTAATTFFSDSFSNGNTLGWTTGTNWAIGAATSSSGHGSGNADPSSDTTTTSDNRIAGTVLGGNLGGSATIFSDGFSSFGNWTESDESDWRPQYRESSSGYSGSSSFSVAHADDCDTRCTLTLTSAIDLSGYGSATLGFHYYLSSELDTGENLKAEVYNGSTWTEVLNKSAEADDDATWHTASISLASYLVSGFKVRFVTTESSTAESVELDDVTITGPAASTTSSLTSPTFDTSASTGTLTLSFKRWLNLNSDFTGKVEIYDGSSWVSLYTSSGAVTDSSWQTMTYDITAYKSASTRLRFSYTGASTTKVSGWNIDDVTVTGSTSVAGTSLCVHDVCAARPACCTTAWTLDCVQLLDDACQVECGVDSSGGSNSCIACFNDPDLTVDVDGDGQSPATGDCRECDPGVSEGAYDLPGNNVDENCDGLVDNETVTCDGSLAATGDAWKHAQAMGLCKVASGNSWGVVSASFVKADGTTACTDSKQYSIMSSFGNNVPTEGSQMAAYSSGTARSTSQSGYVAPNGSGYSTGSSATPKYSVPAATGCSAGTAGLDSCGLKLVLRAPTNANSFSYNFDFFTSEYPEWLCTSYNDAYVAYYEGSLNTATNKNISFDSVGNPVSVNNGLFSVPGIWPPPSLGTNVKLDGTGFGGVCSNSYTGSTWSASSICGGSTDWLLTTAPVAPGEQITLIFNIWDTGDHKWDSTVLLDNFRWSTSSATVGTSHYVPGSDGTVLPSTFTDGWFTRDYDGSELCASDQVPVWALWSWSASTPSDSQIEFYVQAADDAAGLDTAPRDALLFASSTGPSTLVGAAAIARDGSPNTEVGSTLVHDTLVANSRNPNAKHVRVSAHLVPSTDLLSAPLLESWNLQTSCEYSQ